MPDLETPTEGRSQFLLTCDSVDVVLIDRETLTQLNCALIDVVDGLRQCELWQEFVYVAQRYLQKTTETRYCEVGELEHPINSALLFLESWAEKFPDELSLSTHKVSESQQVLYSILALSDMGGGDD